ncbi:hypothetical protein [Moraxella lacunata]
MFGKLTFGDFGTSGFGLLHGVVVIKRNPYHNGVMIRICKRW